MARPVLEYRRPSDRREERPPTARRATLAGASLVLAIVSACLAAVVWCGARRGGWDACLLVAAGGFLASATWLAAVSLAISAVVDRDGSRRYATAALAVCAAEMVVVGIITSL